MDQRLVRAKTKIRDAKIPYETPEPPLLDDRVDGVLAVIYIFFTEGYAVTSGAALMRDDLCAEAIRLSRLPAARAELLMRLGRLDQARDAYRAALAVAKLDPERRHLARRLAALD